MVLEVHLSVDHLPLCNVVSETLKKRTETDQTGPGAAWADNRAIRRAGMRR